MDEHAHEREPERLSAEELEAESATALPSKEVLSLVDLNADVDLALDIAAPIDLAAAANLNVAAPLNASAAANVLSVGSQAGALSEQAVQLDQHLSGEAIASAPQDSTIDQSNDVIESPDTPPPTTGDGSVAVGDLALDGSLLNINVDVDADLDAAAPIAGAVAANANIAAPIDAAVAANVGSLASEATAVSHQSAIINQDLDEVVADATADQTSDITQ